MDWCIFERCYLSFGPIIELADEALVKNVYAALAVIRLAAGT